MVLCYVSLGVNCNCGVKQAAQTGFGQVPLSRVGMPMEGGSAFSAAPNVKCILTPLGIVQGDSTSIL